MASIDGSSRYMIVRMIPMQAPPKAANVRAIHVIFFKKRLNEEPFRKPGVGPSLDPDIGETDQQGSLSEP